MFYLIEITNLKGSEKATTATYSYTNREEAIGTFHQKIGGAMKNDNYMTEMCMVIDAKGSVQIYDYFERTVDEEAEA